MTGAARSTLDQLILQHDVEQLLYEEARLLDDRQFNKWLTLFTDDVHYWMPTRFNRLRDGSDETWDVEKELRDEHGMAWFDETKVSLSQRVARLYTGAAWAEEPPSRTRHLVTNVDIRPAGAEDEIAVRSTFVVYRSRLETEEALFVGRREDLLRCVDGEWKIARRKIIYDSVVSQAKNLSTFL